MFLHKNFKTQKPQKLATRGHLLRKIVQNQDNAQQRSNR